MIVDGASFDPVLLETSRVVMPGSEDERNFHSFYQVLKGLDPGLRHALHCQVCVF